MPKPRAVSHDADAVVALLHKHRLKHLRVRHRADVLTIESGPADDPFAHARLRRDTVHYWRLEMATHTGRWERTPHRGTRDELVTLLVGVYGWTLQEI
jgi:hypothetical protein